jgi:hypothetical protein
MSSGIDVEIIEISALDNMKRRVLTVSVPLTPDSRLEWTGFDTDSGKQRSYTYIYKYVTYMFMFVGSCTVLFFQSPLLDNHHLFYITDINLYFSIFLAV